MCTPSTDWLCTAVCAHIAPHRLTMYLHRVTEHLTDITKSVQSSRFMVYSQGQSVIITAIILVGSINALSYNVVHFFMIQMTSAVTTTVLGEVKIIGLLVLSVLLLGELALCKATLCSIACVMQKASIPYADCCIGLVPKLTADVLSCAQHLLLHCWKKTATALAIMAAHQP